MALSQDMNKIKRYMERQAAKEASATPCQAKGRVNKNGNGGSNNSSRRNRDRNRGRGNNKNSNNNQNQGNTGGRGGNQSMNPLAGHAGQTWGNCSMNFYNTNCRQLQTRNTHNVERRAANLQATPPTTAASGSNLSCNLNCPTRGTAFQEPADAGYESYYAE
jgi:hypothetical protein